MQQVTECDGVERRRIDANRLENVATIRFRPIARDAPGCVLERALIQVDERDARIRCREAALVREVARADADVRVIRGHVRLVVLENAPCRALPYEAVRDA